MWIPLLLLPTLLSQAVLAQRAAELAVEVAALLLPHGVPLEVEVGVGDNWLKAH